MRKRSSPRKATAIHEAGHAVIGRVLGLLCGGANIIPDYENDADGCAIVHDPMATISAWDELDWQKAVRHIGPLNGRDSGRAAYRGTIIARMAGAEAENVILGRCRGGDGFDRDDILRLIEYRETQMIDNMWPGYEPRMRRQTRRLVRKHRDKIERVAAALLERRKLTADEIDELMRPRQP